MVAGDRVAEVMLWRCRSWATSPGVLARLWWKSDSSIVSLPELWWLMLSREAKRLVVGVGTVGVVVVVCNVGRRGGVVVVHSVVVVAGVIRFFCGGGCSGETTGVVAVWGVVFVVVVDVRVIRAARR